MAKYCSFCGKENGDASKFCGSCGKPFSSTKLDTTLEYQKADLMLKKQQLDIAQAQQKSVARCPKCGSTSLTANKKGFGVGKGVLGGVVGASLLGPIGLVGAAAGGINAKKVWVTCLNCGRKFKL